MKFFKSKRIVKNPYKTLDLTQNVLSEFADELSKLNFNERMIIILKYNDKLEAGKIQKLLKITADEYNCLHNSACKKLEGFINGVEVIL